MMNINHTTPPPQTVVRVIYQASDGEVTERLVRITRANETHWYGTDLIKQEPRCFRRAGLVVAQPLATIEEWKAALARLEQSGNKWPISAATESAGER